MCIDTYLLRNQKRCVGWCLLGADESAYVCQALLLFRGGCRRMYGDEEDEVGAG